MAVLTKTTVVNAEKIIMGFQEIRHCGQNIGENRRKLCSYICKIGPSLRQAFGLRPFLK
jgi:hypothetical protein